MSARSMRSDGSYHDLLRLRAGELNAAPDAVLYPRSTNEVLALLAFASEHDIAVVPFGGGTSVVGGVSAASGSFSTLITLDLSGMDRVIDIDATSRTATAEAGIYGPALEKALQAKGMTLGHYPQSFEFSTLGGWIAHRGAGQGSNRYGRAEDWLSGAKLATPRGLLDTNGFPASAAGPQLNDLVLGSEGAFGIITEATVRLHPAPAAADYRGYLFRDFESGTAAIRAAVQEDLPATMLRLSDVEETRFYRAYGALGKNTRAQGPLRRPLSCEARLRREGLRLIAGFEGDSDMVEDVRAAGSAGSRSRSSARCARARTGRALAPGPLPRPLSARSDDGSRDRRRHAGNRDKLVEDRCALCGGAHGARTCDARDRAARGRTWHRHVPHQPFLSRRREPLFHLHLSARARRRDRAVACDQEGGVGCDRREWRHDQPSPRRRRRPPALDARRRKARLASRCCARSSSTLDPKGILNPGKLIPA